MSWIFNRTGNGDKKFSLIFGMVVAVFVGSGTGYAVSTILGVWAGVFWGIIMLLIPFVIIGIAQVIDCLSGGKEKKNEDMET